MGYLRILALLYLAMTFVGGCQAKINGTVVDTRTRTVEPPPEETSQTTDPAADGAADLVLPGEDESAGDEGSDSMGDDESGDDESGDDESGDDESGDDESGDDDGGDDSGAPPSFERAVFLDYPDHPHAEGNVTFEVGGTLLHEFKYALLPDTDDCATATYSDWSPPAVATVPPGADGEKRLCVVGRDVDLVEQATPTEATFIHQTNSAPVFAFTEPLASDDTVGVDASFEISWAISDTDDTAWLNFYFSAASGGDCSAGTPLGLTFYEGSSPTSTLWTPPGIGTYYICAEVSDGRRAPLNVWSDSLNVVAGISMEIPAFEVYGYNTAYQLNLSATDGLAPYTYAILEQTTAAAIVAGALTFTTGGQTRFDDFVLQATDANGIKSPPTPFRLYTEPTFTCIWTGAVSTVWTDPDNWRNCTGVEPQTGYRVVLPSTAARQPTLSANRTILGFGRGAEDGGTLTIADGMRLFFGTDDRTIRSSFRAIGATPDCNNCRVGMVASPELNMHIVDGARVSVGDGIIFGVNTFQERIFLGDGETAGHLEMESLSADPDHWPVLHLTDTAQTTELWGPPHEPSSVRFNGVVAYVLEAVPLLALYDSFDIKQMDRVAIYHRYGFASNGYFLFDHNCGEGRISDRNWSNIDFASGYDPGTDTIIDATVSCSEVGSVSISGTGLGYGSAFDTLDPHNIFTLTDNNDVLAENAMPSAMITLNSTSAYAGSPIPVIYSAADTDDAAKATLFAKSGNGDGCYGDPTVRGWSALANDLPEVVDGLYNWTVGATSGQWFICVMVDDLLPLSPGAFATAGPITVLPDDAVLWMKADAGVSVVNGQVTEWIDQAGGIIFAPAQPNRAPLLLSGDAADSPRLRFDGGDVLSSPATSLLSEKSQLTFFIVASKTEATLAGSGLLATGAPSSAARIALAAGGVAGSTADDLTLEITDGVASAATSVSALATPDVDIFLAVYDGTKPANKISIRQSTAGSIPIEIGTLPAMTPAINLPLVIGGAADSLGFRGEIAEILVFDRALLNSEMRDITTYLSAKHHHEWIEVSDFVAKLDFENNTAVQGSPLTTNATAISYYTGYSPASTGAVHDGASNVEIVHDNVIAMDSSFSVAMWFSPEQLPAWQTLAYKGDDDTERSLLIETALDEISCGGEGIAYVATTNQNLAVGSWYHVACVFDNAANTVQMYINGVVVAEVGDVTGTPAQNTDSLNLGGSPWSGEEYDGFMDDFYFFDRPLTSSEVRFLYEN